MKKIETNLMVKGVYFIKILSFVLFVNPPFVAERQKKASHKSIFLLQYKKRGKEEWRGKLW